MIVQVLNVDLVDQIIHARLAIRNLYLPILFLIRQIARVLVLVLLGLICLIEPVLPVIVIALNVLVVVLTVLLVRPVTSLITNTRFVFLPALMVSLLMLVTSNAIHAHLLVIHV